MEIIQKDNPGINGWFRAVESGDIIGTVTYQWTNDKLLEIDHTEVDQDREGEGIGSKLIEAVVNFAREKDVKIKPVCKFAKAILEGKEGMEDVIAQ